MIIDSYFYHYYHYYDSYMILTIINTQVGGGVAAEAEQALNNIGNILAAAGGG